MLRGFYRGDALPDRPDLILVYRELIVDFLRENPGANFREIADAVGLRSTSSVHYIVRRLIGKGQLAREPCPGCGRDRLVAR